MNCPSCGAEIEVDARYAHFHVCSYCQTASVIDKEAARISGKMAVLAVPRGPLFLGAVGRVKGKGFEVIGRVRYGYENGFWDEWYLRLDDQSTVWISQDEDRLMLETLEREGIEWPGHKLRPGEPVTAGGKTFVIREKGTAICEGGEGQLPFAILMDERVPFYDLESGGGVGTLERESDGAVRLFTGTPLDLDDLAIDNMSSAPDSLQAEFAGGGGRRKRVVKQAGRQLNINCDSCGGSVTVEDTQTTGKCPHCGNRLILGLQDQDCGSCGQPLPIFGGEGAALTSCPACGAPHGVTGEGLKLLTDHAKGDRPKVPIELGQRCKFDGRDYRVIGHLRYHERDGGLYITDEFLLVSAKGSYRWLTLESGHFLLSEPLSQTMTVNPNRLSRKQRVSADGQSFKMFERGTMSVVYVDGELPWVAAVGDKVRYMDAIDPPYLLSAEWTEQEIEWSKCRYLFREEVAQAFGVPASKLPKGRGISPAQPFRQNPVMADSGRIAPWFLLVMAVLAFWAWSTRGTLITRLQVAQTEYKEEFLTEAFPIQKAGSLCNVEFSAPVDNSWVYLDAALINDRDQATHEFSAEVSYYHGYSGGESWSEGSQHRSVVFLVDDPGTYRLLVKGQAGSGSDTGPRPGYGPNVRIEVREGVVLARYFILGFFIALVWTLLCWIPRWSFRSKKWSDD